MKLNGLEKTILLAVILMAFATCIVRAEAPALSVGAKVVMVGDPDGMSYGGLSNTAILKSDPEKFRRHIGFDIFEVKKGTKGMVLEVSNYYKDVLGIVLVKVQFDGWDKPLWVAEDTLKQQ